MSETQGWVDKLVNAGCSEDVAIEIVKAAYTAGSQSRKDKAALGEYSADFEDRFWKPFPRTPVMSKKEAWAAWKRLSEYDRGKVIVAVPRYVEWLQSQRISKPDYPAVHACRFITQRRFDGFSPRVEGEQPVRGFYARCGSTQLEAWDRYWRAIKGKTLPRDRNGGWWVQCEWPPQVEEVA